MTITFSRVVALDPCWTESELAERLPDNDTPVEVTLDGLLSLSTADARWLVTNLMTKQQLITWANGCAERAKGYTARTAAAAADTVAARAAANAAWTASRATGIHANANAALAANAAAVWAADAAVGVDEHRNAMEHALELLNS